MPYIGAVEHAWGADAPDFGQLVKLYGASLPGPARYSPPKIVEAIPTVVHGTPHPALISTSFLVRIHRSPRVTPAMAAGVTDHVWEIHDLLVAAA